MSRRPEGASVAARAPGGGLPNRSVLTGELPAVGTNVFGGEFAAPLAVLRNTELEHNITAMQQWCAARDVALAPHGKTTLAPDLLRLQLAAGAWGITMANPAQARIAAAAALPGS